MANPEKKTSNRYSDSDLAEFQQLIEKKLTLAREQVDHLEEQVLELNESIQTSMADIGENSAYSDVEFINNMIFRQKKYIQDLENALLRVINKSYGICSITGNLIDKKRLLIVPTTTKGLEAKTEEQIKEANKSNPTKRANLSERKPKTTFAKVVSKIKAKKTDIKPIISDDDDDDFDMDGDTIPEVDLGEMDLEGIDD
jgi:RNA polymerase-binding transcription factor DksA